MDLLVIAVRLALFADLLTLFGWAAFALQNGPAAARLFAPGAASRRWLAASALAAMFLSALGLAATAAAMAGVGVTHLDRESVWTVLTGTPFGTAFAIRCLALATVLVVALLVRRPTASLWAIALASAAAASSLAWGGHAVMDEGTAGTAHLVADVVHLLAAGLWIGALVGLFLLLFRPLTSIDTDHVSLSYRALARFSRMGTIIVALIVVTGLVNVWMLVGLANVASLWTTSYGLLLLAKLALFGLMLGLAAANRFWLTPGLSTGIASGNHRDAVRKLRRSLALETGSAFAILGLVAWLGTLEPPGSAM